MLTSIYNWFTSKDTSLPTRMSEQLEVQNNESYNDCLPYICTFSSSELLKYVNKVDFIDIKLMLLYKINRILEDTSINLFKKYNPALIFFFNNELTLLFLPNIHNEPMFKGNVKKTLTHISSYISVLVNKEFNNIHIDKSFIFTGKSVYFNNTYEAFNFFVWRQFDCKRNNINLLYRCIFPRKNLQNMTSVEMLEQLNKQNIVIDIDILNGSIVSKNVQTIKDDFTYSRNTYMTTHEFLGTNFQKFYQKYISNKSDVDCS